MKIQLESIIRQSNHFFYKDKIKHPYIYPDGCIDIDAIQRKKKELTRKDVLEFLELPEKYYDEVLPIFYEVCRCVNHSG